MGIILNSMHKFNISSMRRHRLKCDMDREALVLRRRRDRDKYHPTMLMKILMLVLHRHKPELMDRKK